MGDPAPNPIYRDYVARLRARAEADEAERLAYWRDAPPERHAEVLIELLDLTDALLRSRGRPAEKPPLPEDRFPWPSMRRNG
jgi:hypothetical protein